MKRPKLIREWVGCIVGLRRKMLTREPRLFPRYTRMRVDSTWRGRLMLSERFDGRRQVRGVRPIDVYLVRGPR